jgi:hypothetical protein
MNKLTKIVDLLWQLLAINPDDDWIWYEVSTTLYTQMGGDLRIGLTQSDRDEFNSLNLRKDL